MEEPFSLANQLSTPESYREHCCELENKLLKAIIMIVIGFNEGRLLHRGISTRANTD